MTDGRGAAKKAVAVVSDLFFQSKIREAASLTGVPLAFATTEEALREALVAGGVSLVIVSLEARSPDPFRVLALARAEGGIRTVGYLNHVYEDLRDRALAAGCDKVLPKGAFSKGLPGILTEGTRA